MRGDGKDNNNACIEKKLVGEGSVMATYRTVKVGKVERVWWPGKGKGK